jgi:type VI secretion system protein ImpA
MPSPPLLKVEPMLAPIAGGSPAGPDLRLDYSPNSLFQQIRDAREISRNIERQIAQGNHEYSGDQLEWEKVFKLGTQAIGERSKDFGIAAWVCEAAVRLHGFPGLRDALRLARKLAEDYWSGLYPQPELEEGVEAPPESEFVLTRVKPFEGLFAGALITPVLAIAVTEDGLSFIDYRQSRELEKETDKNARQAKVDAGVVPLGEFMASVNNSSPEFYTLLKEDLDAALDELRRFDQVLHKKCGNDERGFSIAPSIADVEKVLQECQAVVAEFCKLKGLFQPTAGDQPDGQAAGPGQANLPAVAGGKPVGPGGVTREDALQQLSILAEFFRRTEPHSPVSHHIEEAVRWARMGLAELLAELITDDKIRQQVFTRVGIPEAVDKKK